MNKWVLIMLLTVSFAFGQDIGTTKVKVLQGFKPTVPQATRLNQNAAFADTIKKDRTQFYEVIDVNLKSNYTTKPLAVAKVKDDKIYELYATEVELGFGSAFITKANLIHNSRRSKDLSYGIIANHFANKYFLAKNSRNSMHIYAKKIRASHVLYANFEYDRRTSFYSPYEDLEFGNLSAKDFRNRFAYTKFSFSVIANKIYNQKIKNYTNFFVSDLNEFSENQIHLSSNLSKTINNITYNLDISFDDYLRYNNPDSKVESIDLKIFGFSPNVSFKKFGIDLDLGFDVDLADDFSFGLFPKFKATKNLVEDVLLIYGGLDHNEQKHTLKSLSDENPFIHSFGINQSILGDSIFLQQLEITDVQELYVGMRNLLGKDEVFEGRIAYGRVTNFAHFIHVDSEYYNRFNIVYLDVNQLHVHTNYSREINDIISFYANVDYFSWDVDVYHKPNLIVNLGVPINLRNKIKVAPSISYIGERIVNDNSVSILSPQTHANLHFYYFYSKQLSASLELNNLTNSKEDLWLGYREVGFNGLFGINFSF